jgi:hypothetical protein
MFNPNQPPTIKKVDPVKEEEIKKEIERIAAKEAEDEIIGNVGREFYVPGNLKNTDASEAEKAFALTNKKLNDPIWVANQKKKLTEKTVRTGITATDELYNKSQRSALEGYNKEHYGDDRRAA